MHPIYGLFMGVSEMTKKYTLKSKTPFKLTTQLRNLMQSSLFKQTLINARLNEFFMTLKENLETITNCIKKYDKEEFVTALREQVAFYGGHSDGQRAYYQYGSVNHIYST